MEQLYSEADWVSAPPVSDDAQPYQEKVVYNSDLIRPKTGYKKNLYFVLLLIAGTIGSFIVYHWYSVESGFRPGTSGLAAAIVMCATGITILIASTLLARMDYSL